METYVVREPLEVTETLVNRILSAKYVDENGCWIWTKAIDQKGYGRIVIQKQQLGAYVASWRIHNGGDNVPQGLCVMHSCDNSKCINPDHLKLGTHQQNMLHAFAVGRLNVSKTKCSQVEKPCSKKLTQSEVIEIRRLSEVEKLAYKEIAGRFKCSRLTVSKIVRRITHSLIKGPNGWRPVTDEVTA